MKYCQYCIALCCNTHSSKDNDFYMRHQGRLGKVRREGEGAGGENRGVRKVGRFMQLE